MNLASWIILGIVVAIVALAARATFSKKRRGRACCDAGDPISCAGCSSYTGDSQACASCTECPACKTH